MLPDGSRPGGNCLYSAIVIVYLWLPDPKYKTVLFQNGGLCVMCLSSAQAGINEYVSKRARAESEKCTRVVHGVNLSLLKSKMS